MTQPVILKVVIGSKKYCIIFNFKKTIKENTAVSNFHTVKKKSQKVTAFSVRKPMSSFTYQM